LKKKRKKKYQAEEKKGRDTTQHMNPHMDKTKTPMLLLFCEVST
jgi:hypothetical protein